VPLEGIRAFSRICFVLSSHFSYMKGGAELQAYYIAKELLARGFEIHYAYLDSSRDGQPETLETPDGRITLHRLTRYDLGPLGKPRFLNYPQLMRLLEEIEPDLVYQRTRSALTGIAGAYANKRGKKMVWASSSVVDCRRRRLEDIRVDGATAPVEALGYRLGLRGMRRADRIVAQTSDQAAMLRENFALDSVVIPNSHPRPRRTMPKEEPPLVAWIANMKWWKQPELFVELAERCAGLDARFVLVGRADRGYEELAARVKRLGNTELAGELPLEETNELLAKSSVFVNTSLPFEGFPNTFIQAWMRAVPTISLNFDPDGVIERYGIGLHSRTLDRLASDVRRLILDGALRETMGRRAARYAADNHDLSVVADRYVRLFQETLGTS